MASVRPATTADLPFLWHVLALAADWRPGAAVRSPDAVRADPALRHYLDGWPAEGEAGVVAVDGGPVGAAWWRSLPADDPGYGFVDESVPELSIGVVEGARGQGVGRRLLEALLADARQRGLAALSLSVERENPAAELYRDLGFVTVGAVGGSATMLVRLDG